MPGVTRLMIRRELVQYGLQHKTNSEIDAALSSIDQEQMVLDEKAKFTIEVWDGLTPINGVDPEVVKTSHGIGEGCTAYMIKEGQRIVYFQPECPETGASVTEENALQIATSHLENYAKELAIPKIIEAAINELDA